ncbi:MAG TPA: sigma 54-interacting transcriptional regulator [Candidatus Binataceae bacterium]|nr:sigma 54-interacting transcriptional regulator [Candidatus Binataceae bacterium]
MIDMVPALMWSCLSDGSVEYMNKRWLDFTGLKLHEAVGWGWTSTLHPDDVEGLTQVWQEIISTGRAGEAEARLRSSGGEYRWFLMRAEPYRDEHGTVVRWFGTNTDIEDLKRAEREVRDLIDFTPQQIGIMSPAGRRLYANRFALEYAGITLEEYRSPGYMRRFAHPDDLEAINSRGPILRGESYEFEIRLRRKDGAFRWHLFRSFPLRDSSGRILRWYSSGIEIEDRKQLEQRLQNENTALREEIDTISMFEEIIGDSAALQATLSRVSKVAPTESSILVTGETGTGKELIARAIHKRSARSKGPFVSVNCAAIPQALIASELFGHERGAFTGALQKRLGRFEMAAGGTIFLDEIGELPMETQVALLRVLQEREFERLGGSHTIALDVRVIAATNRDLKAAIAEGIFRSDLFYRLNVFPIEVPPLRQRPEDIAMLVRYFVDRYAAASGKRITNISQASMDHLRSYPWPGNVRELQNVIERSVIICETETFSVDPSWLLRNRVQIATPAMPLAQAMETQERVRIEAALAESRGRVSGPSGAAVKLGIRPSTLESKIKALNINKIAFKIADQHAGLRRA